jgi:hypothetical protein
MPKIKKQRKGMNDVLKISKPVRKNGKRVEAVFTKAMEMVSKGETPDLNQLQRDEGYSEESIRCNKVFRTKTWEQMKGKDLESFVKDGFIELADKTNDDKRTRLASLKEMADLLDLYPGKNSGAEMTIEVTRKYFNKKDKDEEGI